VLGRVWDRPRIAESDHRVGHRSPDELSDAQPSGMRRQGLWASIRSFTLVPGQPFNELGGDNPTVVAFSMNLECLLSEPWMTERG
jgi:hypothetical protein